MYMFQPVCLCGRQCTSCVRACVCVCFRAVNRPKLPPNNRVCERAQIYERRERARRAYIIVACVQIIVHACTANILHSVNTYTGTVCPNGPHTAFCYFFSRLYILNTHKHTCTRTSWTLFIAQGTIIILILCTHKHTHTQKRKHKPNPTATSPPPTNRPAAYLCVRDTRPRTHSRAHARLLRVECTTCLCIVCVYHLRARDRWYTNENMEMSQLKLIWC